MQRPPRTTRTLIAAAILLLLLAGCTSGTSSPAQTPEPNAAPGAGPGEKDPRSDAVAEVTQAHVDSAIADLPQSVQAAMQATGTPGVAVGVVWNGELVFAEGYGVRNIDTGEPVDPDTVFPLASVSKSLAATTVARVVDEGTVTWDTPIAKNLPEFTLADPSVGEQVTIADMFAHRSGLYEHAGDELEEIGYDRAAIIERLRLTPLDPWRVTYHYGNFDLTTAAESVARAKGEDWAALSDRLVYQPLGMNSTSSRFADLESRPNRAVGHVKADDKWIVNPEQRQPDQQAPAGGASSSVTDMAKWMTMLLADGQAGGGEFIKPATLLPAVSPQSVSGPPAKLGQRTGFYGYGFNVGTTAGGLVDVNHSGAFAMGAGTVFKTLPDAGLGIVVLANGSANGAVEGIASRFMDIAQFGSERRDWLGTYQGLFASISKPFGSLVGQNPPSAPTPAGELSAYAGEYANPYFGPARVSVDGDALRLALGPTGSWPLEHWSGDEFVFRPSGENALPGSISKATFSGNTLVLEYFDQHGLGTFTR